MHSHGSRFSLVLLLTFCHVCLLRLVSSPCHPCPLDAHCDWYRLRTRSTRFGPQLESLANFRGFAPGDCDVRGEAKFGLRILDSKPSDTGSRGHSGPMDIALSRLAKEKGHRVRVMGVLTAVEHIFNETAMHARAQASNRLEKVNRATHGPRVRV